MSTPSKGMREFWDRRDQQVVDMRADGKSWIEIAEALNMGRQAAMKAAKRYAERHAQTEAAE